MSKENKEETRPDVQENGGKMSDDLLKLDFSLMNKGKSSEKKKQRRHSISVTPSCKSKMSRGHDSGTNSDLCQGPLQLSIRDSPVRSCASRQTLSAKNVMDNAFEQVIGVIDVKNDANPLL